MRPPHSTRTRYGTTGFEPTELTVRHVHPEWMPCDWGQDHTNSYGVGRAFSGTHSWMADDPSVTRRTKYTVRDLDHRGISCFSPAPAVMTDSGGTVYTLSCWEAPRLDPITFPTRNGGIWTAKFLDAAYAGLEAAAENHQADFLAANFLFELSDLPGMLRQLVALVAHVGRSRSLRDFARELSDRGGLTAVSDAHLSNSFGVQPTLGDLKALVKTGQSVAQRLDNLRAANGKVVPFRYSTRITDPTFPWSDELGGYGSDELTSQGFWFPYKLRPKTWSQRYTVKGWVQRRLEGLDDALGPLRALIEAYGFNRFGEILWEAVPFSFVLDWFLGIGNLIKAVRVSPWNGTERMYGVTYGVKTEAEYDYCAPVNHKVDLMGDFVAWDGYQPVGRIQTRWRVRYASWPFHLTDYIDVRPPSPKQALLLGLLAA